MKVSKPLIINDFLVTSVQFTSLNSVAFKNVKSVYEGNEKIALEYEHSSKIEVSSRDWIGLFPRGWSTLQQYITFEWVSQSLPSVSSEQNKENADLTRRTINFYPKYHMPSVRSNTFYQFVYISKQIEVLGVSSYFRFDLTNTTSSSLELECLVPVSSKIRSTSVSDLGILMANSRPSSVSLDTRTHQTSSIQTLQNLDLDGKCWAKPPISLNTLDMKKSNLFQKKIGTGDVLDPYASHSEPVFPMSFQACQCKKWFHFKRGGDFLRSQQVLQSKLKIVMERNKVLEERTMEMRKEMERLQVESKKMKMSYFNINKEKVAYEKFVKDFIKSLEKDSIVRVVNENTEILVKKVNYVGMEEHPRGKKTSKRERELKAVIGLQEITIRNLINSLQEKAKSVKELNETVKLAQAFSAVTKDSQDYGSDAEDTSDEISNSDVTSEYEFSLTKPQPPEDATVHDTDAVLDDIRRTTEMELKDIGINRSLGKSSSRDSNLELPSLSVHSFHNQDEGTGPKKPRLFDNVEDCWPFAENSKKTVHRKIIKSKTATSYNEPDEDNESEKEINGNTEVNLNTSNYNQQLEENYLVDSEKLNAEDEVNFEDYFDAFESSENHGGKVEGVLDPTTSELSENEKKETNFIATAIIPQDMSTPVENVQNDSMKIDEEPIVVEKNSDLVSKKAKKFTCELSIDFTHKKNVEDESGISVLENRPEEERSQTTHELLPLPIGSDTKGEKSLLLFKKANSTFEIKITQVDQKDKPSTNRLQQKMIVKFGKDSEQAEKNTKPPKFEFNLAVTGLGESAKVEEQSDAKVERTETEIEYPESERMEREIEYAESEISKIEATPRTVWNDANDMLEEEMRESIEGQFEEENEEVEIAELSPLPGASDAIDDAVDDIVDYAIDKDNCEFDVSKEETPDNNSNINMKSYEDSLRYEKNLEFLQQKVRDEETVARDKPSAILIQDGQTKLALIRY